MSTTLGGDSSNEFSESEYVTFRKSSLLPSKTEAQYFEVFLFDKDKALEDLDEIECDPFQFSTSTIEAFTFKADASKRSFTTFGNSKE